MGLWRRLRQTVRRARFRSFDQRQLTREFRDRAAHEHVARQKAGIKDIPPPTI